MKKINNIRQLKAEKEKMAQHQEVLERRIRNNWSDLKSNMKPVDLATETIGEVLSNKSKKGTTTKPLMYALLTLGGGFLLKKMIGKKLSRFFGKK